MRCVLYIQPSGVLLISPCLQKIPTTPLSAVFLCSEGGRGSSLMLSASGVCLSVWYHRRCFSLLFDCLCWCSVFVFCIRDDSVGVCLCLSWILISVWPCSRSIMAFWTKFILNANSEKIICIDCYYENTITVHKKSICLERCGTSDTFACSNLVTPIIIFYACQGWIYLIKNAVKIVILWILLQIKITVFCLNIF